MTLLFARRGSAAPLALAAAAAGGAPRRALAVAALLSLAVHGAAGLWPAPGPTTPDEAPLQAVLTEMPAPPKPEAPPAHRTRVKPRRSTAAAAPVARPEPSPETVAGAEGPAAIEPTADALAMGPEAPAETIPPPADESKSPPKTLPRRVDLVYKAYLGTDGMLIGQAIYRFEHAGGEYRIATVAEAKGLAALFLRGQGKLESRGLITAEGLQPTQFVVERGGADRREVASFDWESGIVTLTDRRIEALELPTYDPLALMWQPYFTPPVDDAQEVNIATTRRVGHYTITREGEETIRWSQGEIATERWHRRSDDGKTDAYVWVAPSLRYVPVRMRLHARYGGIIDATLEATLDSIRVDETIAQQ